MWKNIPERLTQQNNANKNKFVLICSSFALFFFIVKLVSIIVIKTYYFHIPIFVNSNLLETTPKYLNKLRTVITNNFMKKILGVSNYRLQFNSDTT